MVFSRGATLFYAHKCQFRVFNEAINLDSVYLPLKREALAYPKSSLEYDEDAAPFYWGLNIPKNKHSV